MKAAYLSDKFKAALPYDQYVLTGTEEQQRRWKTFHDTVHLTAAQTQLTAGFVREMKILIISGIWCGDCVQQCPIIQHIARSNPKKIELRLVDRDQHRDLAEQVRINTGDRVPVVLLLAEDYEWCATAGDRTISRYRAIALRQLGPACPTGIVAPEKAEVDATVSDWMNEVERVQLMLRLSSRLRAKYQD